MGDKGRSNAVTKHAETGKIIPRGGLACLQSTAFARLSLGVDIAACGKMTESRGFQDAGEYTDTSYAW